MASLRSLVESRLVSALSSITTANIYAGQTNTDKQLPCIICTALRADEMMKDSGNYDVTVSITIKGLAANIAAYDTICESVRSLIATDQFVTDLNAANFKVWGVAGQEQVEWGDDGDALTETKTLILACAATTFPS